MPPLPPVPSPELSRPSRPSATDDRLAAVRFRRAVSLMLMTLVLPGSAQLAAGRAEVGRLALRIWCGVVGTVVLLALLGMVWPRALLTLGSSTLVLGLIRFALMALAVGWAVLFVDAWRLGRPLELRQKQRLAVVGLNGVLSLSVAGALLFASHVVGVQRDLVTTMFGASEVTDSTDGRFNVLLLGGDSGADRWGMRADSITLASIDEDTGHTVLFGLPRNMQNFPFAEGSVMDKAFPRGFDCEDCYLNSLTTFAADNPDLFHQRSHPGVQATRQAVEGITGLDVNYYAMVDLKGFSSLVDALGGVRLNVRDRIPIGGVGAPVTGYIEPGLQQLNGFQTLWFARSREGADDYSRMARQKCVMGAMLDQLDPKTVVTRLGAIAEAGKKLVTTDLPASELDTFVPLALKAKSQPMSTVSFVPPRVNTAAPDIAAIQRMVETAVEKSEAREDAGTASTDGADRARSKKRAGATGPAATTGGSIGSLAEGYEANYTADLGSAC